MNRTTLSLVVAALFAAVTLSHSHAASVTNSIVNIKYTETLRRNVTFKHLGPFIGDYALFTDKGTCKLSFTVSLDGVLPTAFTERAEFLISYLDENGRPSTLGILRLSDDPKFGLGKSRANIKFLTDDKGKSWGLASLSFDWLSFELDVKITLNYLRLSKSSGQVFSSGGFPLFAFPLLGTTTTKTTTPRSKFLIVRLADPTYSQEVAGIGSMSYLGTVVTKPVTDREIGTFNKSTVILGGASPPD